MKYLYNFWILPISEYHGQSNENPYSAIDGTLKHAKNWAKFLLEHHPRATGINFKSENGWKTYYIEQLN